MLDRYSGKLLHIDFGDCFEARTRSPEFPSGGGMGGRQRAHVWW